MLCFIKAPRSVYFKTTSAFISDLAVCLLGIHTTALPAYVGNNLNRNLCIAASLVIIKDIVQQKGLGICKRRDKSTPACRNVTQVLCRVQGGSYEQTPHLLQEGCTFQLRKQGHTYQIITLYS